MTKRKPTVVSLFAGCGGLDFGLARAGYRTVWAIDKDPDACETFKENVGNIECGDITKVKIPNLGFRPDLLTSGFPCQPFSSSGARRGTDDVMGDYYNTTLEYIKNLSPKAVLIENVRGLATSKTRSGMILVDKIKHSLEELGYNVSWKILDFSEYGVPQQRKRLILIGVKNKRFLSDAFPVKQGSGVSIKKALIGLNSKVPNQSEIIELNPQAKKLGQLIPEGGSWNDVPTKFLPKRLKILRKHKQKNGSPRIYRCCNMDDIMTTVTAKFTPEMAAVWHPKKNRAFSVREIARFQSFPDNFVFFGKSVKSKYRQIGNAVPPLIGELIGNSLRPYFL